MIYHLTKYPSSIQPQAPLPVCSAFHRIPTVLQPVIQGAFDLDNLCWMLSGRCSPHLNINNIIVVPAMKVNREEREAGAHSRELIRCLFSINDIITGVFRTHFNSYCSNLPLLALGTQLFSRNFLMSYVNKATKSLFSSGNSRSECSSGFANSSTTTTTTQRDRISGGWRLFSSFRRLESN